MSSLTVIDRRYLEKFLEMGGGYVLNYSDKTYGAFFGRHAGTALGRYPADA